MGGELKRPTVYGNQVGDIQSRTVARNHCLINCVSIKNVLSKLHSVHRANL